MEVDLNLKLEKSSRTNWGCCCSYFEYTEEIGFKVFSDVDDAVESQKAQKIAFSYGVGPEVFSEVFFIRKGFKSYSEWINAWGYFTENCIVRSTDDDYNETWYMNYGLCGGAMSDLFDELQAAGFSGSDFHSNNVGIRRSTQTLVCIDFDPYHSPYEGKE